MLSIGSAVLTNNSAIGSIIILPINSVLNKFSFLPPLLSNTLYDLPVVFLLSLNFNIISLPKTTLFMSLTLWPKNLTMIDFSILILLKVKLSSALFMLPKAANVMSSSSSTLILLISLISPNLMIPLSVPTHYMSHSLVLSKNLSLFKIIILCSPSSITLSSPTSLRSYLLLIFFLLNNLIILPLFLSLKLSVLPN